MARNKKPDYAALKANRALAKDIVGYDSQTSIIGGMSKIQILDAIIFNLDAGDTIKAKEVCLEFKKRLVQYQMAYGITAKAPTK